MELVYKGKTKDVYKLGDGNVLLKFKDDVTTDADGNFDPGANSIGGAISGMGLASLRMSAYYFSLLHEKGVPTHFISADIAGAGMTVKPAEKFGADNLEVICRFRAIGSFYRRYKAYCKEGMELDALVEFTLKDDALGDPFIDKYALMQLKIVSEYEYVTLVTMAKHIASILKADLAEKGLELYDAKFEFGKINGEIVLMDEISPGNFRAYKGSKWIQPLELAEYYK